MIKNLNIIFAIIFLSACSLLTQYSVNSVQIASSFIELNRQYSNVVFIIQSNSNKFDQSELEKLKQIDHSITFVRDKIKTLISKPSLKESLEMTNIIELYIQVKESYLNAFDIITKKLNIIETKLPNGEYVLESDNISSVELYKLNAFHNNAKKLDSKLQEIKMNSNQDVTNFVYDLIVVATGALHIVSLL